MAAPTGTTPVFTIRGPLALVDVRGLCARLRTMLGERGAAVALCDVDRRVDADLVAIEALARLQLAARRSGSRLQLGNASAAMHDLVAFVGLGAELGVEPGGQAEEREEVLGVEEERELDDPVA